MNADRFKPGMRVTYRKALRGDYEHGVSSWVEATVVRVTPRGRVTIRAPEFQTAFETITVSPASLVIEEPNP